MSKTYPYRYENCKDCVARCPHAGKDRKFVYHGFKSCKIVKEPPILDRSAWEPCAYCRDYSGKCCANCWNGGKQAYQEPCKSCYCASKWKPKENFCPCCGRPMHDAAWEMLQKRLEGHK